MVNWENEILVNCNPDLQDLLHCMMYKQVMVRGTAKQYMDHCYMQTEVVRKKDFLELACWLNQQSTKKHLGEEFQEGQIHPGGADFGEDNNVGRSYKVETGMKMRRYKYESINTNTDEQSGSDPDSSHLPSLEEEVINIESVISHQVSGRVETPLSYGI